MILYYYNYRRERNIIYNNFWNLVFSKYYKGILSSQKVPYLNVEQHRRLLNILDLEIELKIINDLKERIKCSDDLYKLNVKNNRLEKQLKDLYKSNTPKEILMDMIKKSSN